MADERTVARTTKISEYDQCNATGLAPTSSPGDRHLLVSGVEASHESTLEASISVLIQTEFPHGQVLHFLMTPPAARQLSKALQKAVKEYLRHSPDSRRS